MTHIKRQKPKTSADNSWPYTDYTDYDTLAVCFVLLCGQNSSEANSRKHLQTIAGPILICRTPTGLAALISCPVTDKTDPKMRPVTGQTGQLTRGARPMSSQPGWVLGQTNCC